jgi:molecular chaperone HscB
MNCVQCGALASIQENSKKEPKAPGDPTSSASALGRHLCAVCQAPLPISSEPMNHFDVLGMPIAFDWNQAVAERRFYELSRALHPDRFSTALPAIRAASLARMGLVNESWVSLKSKEGRRDYLADFLLQKILARTGKKRPAPLVPAELAEEWFELQEEMVMAKGGQVPEQVIAGRGRIEAFAAKLSQLTTDTENQLDGTGRELDAILAVEGPDSIKLEPATWRLVMGIQEFQYLKSLQRDLKRLGGDASGRTKLESR